MRVLHVCTVSLYKLHMGCILQSAVIHQVLNFMPVSVYPFVHSKVSSSAIFSENPERRIFPSWTPVVMCSSKHQAQDSVLQLTFMSAFFIIIHHSPSALKDEGLLQMLAYGEGAKSVCLYFNVRLQAAPGYLRLLF